MSKFTFNSIEEFDDSSTYYSQCCTCGKNCEISVESIYVIINGIHLKFDDLQILKCVACGREYFPLRSIYLVKAAFNYAKTHGKKEGEFKRSSYREKFKFCENINFDYDAYDYYNIPGLIVGDSEGGKGFLTPVYFEKKALQIFFNDDDYVVELFSESYGNFEKLNDWSIPFGINTNGKVVFWLGDLNTIDVKTLSVLKCYNMPSDHKIICSEFYAAQLCCVWANPNKEYILYKLRKELYDLIKNKKHVNLYHLENEVDSLFQGYHKPIVVNINSLKNFIEVFHKIVIEGVDINALKCLCKIELNHCDNIDKLGSIKLYELILAKFIGNGKELHKIIAPIYVLNDLRIYFDHLLSTVELNRRKSNILKTIGVTSLEQANDIYEYLLKNIAIFYQYIIIIYSK